jgi:hypothetical protein
LSTASGWFCGDVKVLLGGFDGRGWNPGDLGTGMIDDYRLSEGNFNQDEYSEA